MIVGTTEAESWRCRFPSRQTFQESGKNFKYLHRSPESPFDRWKSRRGLQDWQDVVNAAI